MKKLSETPFQFYLCLVTGLVGIVFVSASFGNMLGTANTGSDFPYGGQGIAVIFFSIWFLGWGAAWCALFALLKRGQKWFYVAMLAISVLLPLALNIAMSIRYE